MDRHQPTIEQPKKLSKFEGINCQAPGSILQDLDAFAQQPVENRAATAREPQGSRTIAGKPLPHGRGSMGVLPFSTGSQEKSCGASTLLRLGWQFCVSPVVEPM
jgi:hypothetical protein